jgi:hypothetical protein
MNCPLRILSGTLCDAQDRYGNWYVAQILHIDEKGSVLVHFLLFSHFYDEWILYDVLNLKLAARGSHDAERAHIKRLGRRFHACLK